MQPEKYPDFIAYHFLNASGELVGMEEDGSKTEKYLESGFNVDGSSIKGMAKVEKSDLRIMPEKDTYLTIKLDDFVHHRFMCCSFDDKGSHHPRDPRGILKKLVDKAHSMGYEPYMFSEVEFYIVDEDGKPVDKAGYCSLPPADKSYDFRQELGKMCKELGMKVRRIHHENGFGQNEIELDFTPCMKNADDTILCMWILEMLAAKRKQRIIFSPKPFPDDAGNGLHHHVLLRDIKTGQNVFMNPDFKGDVNNPEHFMGRLSEACKHGIAGFLKYGDDITAAFASSPETFARLKPGFEAPIFKAWDFSNRTALVRVPKSDISMTRFEYRGGDLSGSVHIYGAVLLAAALKGIEDKLPLPPNANFNVEELSEEERAKHNITPVPLSFEKCIEVLKGSAFLNEALGPEMVQYLIERDEACLKGGPAKHH